VLCPGSTLFLKHKHTSDNKILHEKGNKSPGIYNISFRNTSWHCFDTIRECIDLGNNSDLALTSIDRDHFRSNERLVILLTSDLIMHCSLLTYSTTILATVLDMLAVNVTCQNVNTGSVLTRRSTAVSNLRHRQLPDGHRWLEVAGG